MTRRAQAAGPFRQNAASGSFRQNVVPLCVVAAHPATAIASSRCARA